MVAHNHCDHGKIWANSTTHSILQFMPGLPMHQSMLITRTLSVELRDLVQTVGGTQLIFNFQFVQKTTLIAVVHTFNWLILTWDQSSIVRVTIMCGLLGQVVVSCCSYSQQKSTWLPSHCTTTVNIAAVPPGDSAGLSSVSTNVRFYTQKVLMFKSGSTYPLAVSEVKFFKNCSSSKCNGTFSK